MAKIIGEYRFVFLDETESGKSNSSLSSTTKQANKVRTEQETVANPVQSPMKTFSKVTAGVIGAGATGLNVYRTIRDVAINKQTTDAVISGNLHAARNLSVQKANQDRQINQAMSVVGYIAQGAAIGAMGGGYGAIIGAGIGMIVGISTSLYRGMNEHTENMRRYEAELSEQRYLGSLESKRLVNMTGRVR